MCNCIYVDVSGYAKKKKRNRPPELNETKQRHFFYNIKQNKWKNIMTHQNILEVFNKF